MAAKTLKKPSVLATNLMNLQFACLSFEATWQAIRLHIFDELDKKSEPVAVTTLAADLSVNPEALERVMNTCTTLGLLVRTEKDSKVSFTNSEEASVYLTKRSPYNLSDCFAHLDHLKMLIPKFDETIKMGKQQVHQTIKVENADAEDIFAAHYGSKEMFHIFASSMEALASTGLHVLADLKLQSFAHTVDLGGSLGMHARRLKSLYPDMKVTLADLKLVVDEARTQDANKQAGIEYAACDFMKAETLPKADLYLLGHILHDWNDDQCKLILRNVYQALNQGGCILIMETVMQNSKTGVLMDNLMDMLMATSGKERTEKEYKELLTSQGYKDIKLHRDESTPVYDAIFAYKK